MTENISEDLAGFAVSALDGQIGKVIDVVEDEMAGSRCLVVRPRLLHRCRLIPTRAVQEIDVRRHRVRVAMTTYEITHAPRYHDHPVWQSAHEPSWHRDLWERSDPPPGHLASGT